MGQIRLKRVYDPPSRSDGTRVLVDRLWPRGISKDELRIDLWAKDLAPSTELRKWFNHDPAKWDEFKRRYRKELDEHPAAVDAIFERLRQGDVTLVFAAKDADISNAAALKEYVEHIARQHGGR
jgi:uncharacterized protein YeaO (DUF488 family)